MHRNGWSNKYGKINHGEAMILQLRTSNHRSIDLNWQVISTILFLHFFSKFFNALVIVFVVHFFLLGERF